MLWIPDESGGTGDWPLAHNRRSMMFDKITVALGEAGSIDVVANNFNQAVTEYIFAYGLKQMLNDVHASVTKKVEADDAKRAASKRALVEKKLDSLYAGNVAQARTSASGSPVERKMKELADIDLKAMVKTKLGKKVGDFDKAVWAKMVEKLVDGKAEQYRTAAEKILAVKVEEVEFDLDDLMADDEETEEGETEETVAE